MLGGWDSTMLTTKQNIIKIIKKKSMSISFFLIPTQIKFKYDKIYVFEDNSLSP